MKKIINKINKNGIIILFLLVIVFLVGGSLDDDGDGSYITLIFFLSGPIFYLIIANFYSGKDKRHFHEKETESDVRNLRENDVFIKAVKKTQESSIGTITYSNQVNSVGIGTIADKIMK